MNNRYPLPFCEYRMALANLSWIQILNRRTNILFKLILNYCKSKKYSGTKKLIRAKFARYASLCFFIQTINSTCKSNKIILVYFNTKEATS